MKKTVADLEWNSFSLHFWDRFLQVQWCVCCLYAAMCSQILIIFNELHLWFHLPWGDFVSFSPFWLLLSYCNLLLKSKQTVSWACDPFRLAGWNFFLWRRLALWFIRTWPVFRDTKGSKILRDKGFFFPFSMLIACSKPMTINHHVWYYGMVATIMFLIKCFF